MDSTCCDVLGGSKQRLISAHRNFDLVRDLSQPSIDGKDPDENVQVTRQDRQADALVAPGCAYPKTERGV
ncbi:hypothetical protein FA10DRAFT_183738 [Acaromyces ingoldii]|uniref:Uncharacterized protein n=1 Tax=Acaromyces ingoldii TaxID=215250 RepID=A0A316YCA2_9BASI|nr:hypothetical protein FA10DRAFT_183738 [Acaromyces ingoldii]PWN87370.1 hypothetical protein FA10DRAFT_183738 [Acaromyces ingoldii]